ncbi:cytochrome P450 [Neurospora tetraspora]|uniref:Cytochrome P450 monooxygenase ABA1 n=1 Tax=Neurospora tetraspora TaxID=94610 RepID=A0AAE0JQR8_9PEZI|nr:cytochrome P450 [Neurospora tetraspora]
MGAAAVLYEARWFLAFVVLAIWVVLKIKQYYRLRHFKGPFGTGWFEIWHGFAYFSNNSHMKFKEATDRYGPIARIGPNELMTTSIELLAHINGARNRYTRTRWWYLVGRFQPNRDTIFSEVDEAIHTKRRAQMAGGYSGKENPDLESSVDIHVAELVQLIRTKYCSTETKINPFDLAKKTQYLAIDVISHIGFGEPFGDLLSDQDVNGYIEDVDKGTKALAYLLAFGLTELALGTPLMYLLGRSEKAKTGFGAMTANTRRIISKRLEDDPDMSKGTDMLASWFRHGLDKEQLVTESILQLMAGAETAATSMRSIMLYLLTHPRVYARLQAEVDAAVKDGRAAPYPSVVSNATQRQLPYLWACCKEGMRMHPPVTNSSQKKVPPEGDTVMVEGKTVYLPGGTNIGYCVWGLNRDQKIFGADADYYRPERWLNEEDPKKLAQMNQVHEMLFGYGKYQCLGKPIALMEIGKAIFELMRNFDWSVTNVAEPWKETNIGAVFRTDDFLVEATERSVS